MGGGWTRSEPGSRALKPIPLWGAEKGEEEKMGEGCMAEKKYMEKKQSLKKDHA